MQGEQQHPPRCLLSRRFACCSESWLQCIPPSAAAGCACVPAAWRTEKPLEFCSLIDPCRSPPVLSYVVGSLHLPVHCGCGADGQAGVTFWFVLFRLSKLRKLHPPPAFLLLNRQGRRKTAFLTRAVLACCGQGAAPAVPPPPAEPAMVEQILQKVLRQWREFDRASKDAICATRLMLRKFCGQTRRGTRRGGQKYQGTPLHSPLRTAILKQTALENAQLCAMRHGGLCNV